MYCYSPGNSPSSVPRRAGRQRRHVSLSGCSPRPVSPPVGTERRHSVPVSARDISRLSPNPSPGYWCVLRPRPARPVSPARGGTSVKVGGPDWRGVDDDVGPRGCGAVCLPIAAARTIQGCRIGQREAMAIDYETGFARAMAYSLPFESYRLTVSAECTGAERRLA